MKKKIWIPIIAVTLLTGIFLLIYPNIEIQTDDKFIVFRYSDDISEFESEISYNESYAYYAERDISIKDYDFKKFLFFHVITMDYVEGNYCDTQFILEESYIDDFLERAKIEYNDNNITLKGFKPKWSLIYDLEMDSFPENYEDGSILNKFN